MTTDDRLDDPDSASAVLNDPDWWVTAAVDLTTMALPPRRRWYTEFTIPKKDGSMRLIRAPIPPIKAAQRRLVCILEHRGGGVTPYAHAYVRRRSVLSMAAPHVGRAVVVKIDVKDFFNSIDTMMTFNALAQARTDDCVIDAVSRLSFDDRRLPTGAPTSPILSNIYAAQFLDHIIAAICKKWRTHSWRSPRIDSIAYTRYADDIVLSSNYRRLSEIIPVIRHALRCAGLTMNEDKVRVLRQRNSQVVCGVVVNKSMGTRRPRRNRLRGFLHRLLCDGLSGLVPLGLMRDDKAPLFNLPIPISHLAGEVGFCSFVNKNQASRLTVLLDAVRHVHFGKEVGDDVVRYVETTRRKVCCFKTQPTEACSSSTESDTSPI
jgi:RNA-directed DNA polymerase